MIAKRRTDLTASDALHRLRLVERRLFDLPAYQRSGPCRQRYSEEIMLAIDIVVALLRTIRRDVEDWGTVDNDAG